MLLTCPAEPGTAYAYKQATGLFAERLRYKTTVRTDGRGNIVE